MSPAGPTRRSRPISVPALPSPVTPSMSATVCCAPFCGGLPPTSNETAPGTRLILMTAPVVLDFDGSVGPLPDAVVLPLGAWQERIRFGCGMRTYREFARVLDRALPAGHGAVFLGSGDFHHVSHALIARRCPPRRVKVVVLDNHPDNMRFPFGIHCGSWVRRGAGPPSRRPRPALCITASGLPAPLRC